jgi:pimeloyl-ACP methyl ester carboxylesterase
VTNLGRALLAGALLSSVGLGLATPVGAATGPAPGSPAYMARDIENMEAAFGRNEAQLEDPTYLPQFFAGAATLFTSQLATQLDNPTRPSLTAGSLVPGFAASNPDRQHWNGTRGIDVPVTFTAGDGAALQGDVFAPLPGARDPYSGALLHGPYPGAVIVTGSIQASRNEYAWLAEDLAERGYVVLTFDVQGQGQSETLPHLGHDPDMPNCGPLGVGPGQVTTCPGVPSEQDQNFVDSTEDAISFFLSTPPAPYANVQAGSLAVNRYNPLWHLFNHTPDTRTATPGRTTRLALIGHSTGAVIATYLQGVDPRIETVVALDKLTATPAAISDDEAETGSLPGPVVPKVPALALQSEYGFEPQPYFVADCSSFEPCLDGGLHLNAPPDPNREEDTGFDAWRAAHVDSMIIVPRASTHLIYTDSPPVLPATVNGQQMASYYVQAWLDKYLKHDPAAGFALLSPTIRYFGPDQDGQWTMHTFGRDANLSFYFCSGYEFNLAGGKTFADPDIIGDGCS